MTLNIGSQLTAKTGSLVNFYARPEQILHQAFTGTRYESRLIRILDPEQKFSAQMPGVQEIVKSCAQTAQMQVTRGTGGEANAHLVVGVTEALLQQESPVNLQHFFEDWLKLVKFLSPVFVYMKQLIDNSAVNWLLELT